MCFFPAVNKHSTSSRGDVLLQQLLCRSDFSLPSNIPLGHKAHLCTEHWGLIFKSGPPLKALQSEEELFQLLMTTYVVADWSINFCIFKLPCNCWCNVNFHPIWKNTEQPMLHKVQTGQRVLSHRREWAPSADKRWSEQKTPWLDFRKWPKRCWCAHKSMALLQVYQ